MKEIYLTEQSKQEIETKILELEEIQASAKTDFEWNKCVIEKNVYKEILSSATILPVEESWERLEENLLEGLHEHTKLENVISIDYPNGVIIQPNQ
jgi:GTP-sensing pleiotropic transcriptional regulator CodY